MRDLKSIIHFMEVEIPFNRHLGLKVDHLTPGCCIMRLPWREEFIGDPKRRAVHGGVISSLIDATGGLSCWSLLEGLDDRISTVDLRVDYIQKGPPTDLLCEANVVRMGNRVSVARMEVISADDENKDKKNIIATGQAVYNIWKAKRH